MVLSLLPARIRSTNDGQIIEWANPVRIATPADVPNLTALINAAFQIAEGFFVNGERIRRREVEQHMERLFSAR